MLGAAAGVKPTDGRTQDVPAYADAGTLTETGPGPGAVRSGKALKEGSPKANTMVIRDRGLKWV